MCLHVREERCGEVGREKNDGVRQPRRGSALPHWGERGGRGGRAWRPRKLGARLTPCLVCWGASSEGAWLDGGVLPCRRANTATRTASEAQRLAVYASA